MTTKEKVLAKLKAAEQLVSGEMLAQELNVSRTAIWKAIKELEKMGYTIEHHATGYRYHPSDILDAQEIQRQISVPVTVKTLATSASTMKDAQLAAANGESTPFLIVADMQEAPHGRFARPFFAMKKSGIYMSLLLRPAEKLHQLPQYTVLMAVAVTQAIDELTRAQPQIKWVNDIYINGKKIAGILSEALTNIETNSLHHIVIGVGLNFSIPQEAFPADIQQKAGSLFPDGKPTITRNQLIIAIWQRFFALLEEKNNDYLTVYRERSYVLGKKVFFQKQAKNYVGKAVAITENGELVVDLGTETMTLSSGEISLSAIE